MARIHESNVSIRASATHGRGLFAINPQSAGAALFELKRPLVAVVDSSRLHDTCSNCFKWVSLSHAFTYANESVDPVRACVGCHTLRFCSKKCQSLAWKRNHKYECPILKATQSMGHFPGAARALLQMIHIHDDQASDSFENFQSHLDDIERASGQRLENLEILVTAVIQYSQSKTPLAVVRWLCSLLLTNSLTVVSPTFDPLGICLDPVLSAANHSCDPNAVIVHDGARVSIRALKEIKAGEEVFISYIDCTDPYYRRQATLSRRFYFTCNCSKCQNGPGGVEDDFLAITSDVSKSDLDQELPNIDFDSQPSPEANGEDFLGRSTVLKKLGTLQQLSFQALESAKTETSSSGALKLINTGLKYCRPSRLWPIHRQPVPSLLHQRMLNLLTSELWVDALFIACQTAFLIDPVIFPQTLHPVRVAHLWILAMILLQLNTPDGEELVYQKARTMGYERRVDMRAAYIAVVVEVSSKVDQSHGPASRFANVVVSSQRDIAMQLNEVGAPTQEIASMVGNETACMRQINILAQLAEASVPLINIIK